MPRLISKELEEKAGKRWYIMKCTCQEYEIIFIVRNGENLKYRNAI
jgi:hypothetical protein